MVALPTADLPHIPAALRLSPTSPPIKPAHPHNLPSHVFLQSKSYDQYLAPTRVHSPNNLLTLPSSLKLFPFRSPTWPNISDRDHTQRKRAQRGITTLGSRSLPNDVLHAFRHHSSPSLSAQSHSSFPVTQLARSRTAFPNMTPHRTPSQTRRIIGYGLIQWLK